MGLREGTATVSAVATCHDIAGIWVAFFQEPQRQQSLRTGHEEDTEHAMIEAAMFFFASMASFYVAEIFHLSGIISALFAGMVCNHYAWYNLTPLAQELSKHFYEQMMLVRFNSILIRF